MPTPVDRTRAIERLLAGDCQERVQARVEGFDAREGALADLDS